MVNLKKILPNLRHNARERKRLCRFVINFSLILSLLLQNYLFLVNPAFAASSPWSQTDWSGGSGQTIWSDNTKFSSSSNVTTSTAGQATLDNTLTITEKLSNTDFESNLTGWDYLAAAYDLQDQFTTNRATGAVNGTSAEPTGGTRTVTDTESKLSIASGALTFVGGKTSPAYGDPRIVYPSIQRAAGKTFLADVDYSVSNKDSYVGLSTSATPGNPANANVEVDINPQSNGTLYSYLASSTTFANLGSYTATSYKIATVLRSSGAFYFMKGGAFTNWTLMYIQSQGNTAALYPAIVNRNSVFTADNIRIPTATWLPTPLASDGFSGATTDGMGHAEANGGSGLAWTNTIGTWQSSSNVASATALSGGIAARTLDAGNADVLIDVAPARSAGNAGIVFRYQDSSNYLIAYHDGTNVHLDTVIAGVTASKINAAKAYSAGAVMRIIAEGSSISLYYNDAKIGLTQTISNFSTKTIHGLYTTDTGNTFDNFVVWPRSGYDVGVNDTGLTPTRDTGTYYQGAASAKLITGGNAANFTQSVNVENTLDYILTAYAYTDGSAVTTNDLDLYYDTAELTTTFTPVGGNWYKLTGTITGVASSKAYGVRVHAGKTVYVDNASLIAYASSGTLTSSMFDTDQLNTWGTFIWSANTPTNTTLKFQIRTAGTQSGLSSATWYGPTGTADYYTTSGTTINSVHSKHRWIQYKAFLSATEASATPTLLEVSISYSASATTQPILVLTDNDSSNVYHAYITEILDTEGILGYETLDISYNPGLTFLSNFDIVILTDTSSLSSDLVTALSSYVSDGGNLIGLSPDTQLASVFGLTSSGVGVTTSEQYLKIDTTTTIGNGVTSASMQFHGDADDYSLNGASSIALIYSDADTPTTKPAVSLYQYESGSSVAFTYDLAKSSVLFHQGKYENRSSGDNPDPDGDGIYTQRDLFYNYLDDTKANIPQADEQQDLLVNAINYLANLKKPLPRLWYYPSKAMSVTWITGDGDNATTANIQAYADKTKEYGGYYTYFQWTGDAFDDTLDNSLLADGHSTANHPNLGCGVPTLSYAQTQLSSQIQAFITAYGHQPLTDREHCLNWVGWTEHAQYLSANGIRINSNATSSIGNFGDKAYPNGSGLPMKLMDESGNIIDLYEQSTTFYEKNDSTIVDESFDDYHSVLTYSFHPVYAATRLSWVETAASYSQSKGIPMVSGDAWANFVDARRDMQFQNIQSAGNSYLTFDITQGTRAINNATIMIPANYGSLSAKSIKEEGITKSFTTSTIDGVSYALLDVSLTASQTKSYVISYDETPPTISSVVSNSINPGATITWTTNESSSSKVDYGLTNSYGSSTTEADTSTRVTSHSVTLSGLFSCTTYHYRVRSKDAATNEVVGTDNTFITSGCPSPPACSDVSPGGKALWLYRARPQDSSSILLYFTGADNPVDRYALEYGTKSGSYQYGAANIGGKEIRTYLVKSLSPNTTYYFRVRAGNGCATGPWSNEMSARTKFPWQITSTKLVSEELIPVSARETFAPREEKKEIPFINNNVSQKPTAGIFTKARQFFNKLARNIFNLVHPNRL